MCADARGNEPGLAKALAVDDVHAVGHHVGDEERLAVRRDADVLRHAFPRRADDLVAAVDALDGLRRHARLEELEVTQHLAVHEVDLRDGAGEFAGEDREAAVDREIGVVDAATVRNVERVLHLHRLRVAEIEALVGFGDDDGRFAIRREIHVVRIVDPYRLAGLAGARIDRRQAADLGVLGVVRDPERAHVPRRDDVLRIEPTRNLSTTFSVAGSIT